MAMDQNNQTDVIDTYSSMSKLPREVAIMKMENETIQAMTVAHPRNILTVRDNLKSQLEEFPSFAREAIYRKPVGRDRNGVMKYARNLSIRAAEAVAEAYGYNYVRSYPQLIEGHDDLVMITAVFFDYQTARKWEDTGIVSKVYKGRDQRMRRHADDHFYSVVVRAEASKRIREVIMRCVTPGLRAELFEHAERAMAALMSDEQTEKVIAKFGAYHVTQEMLEAHLGAPLKAWTQEHRLLLLQDFNAIKHEETTVEDLFVTEAGKQQPVAGEVSMEDLIGGNDERESS